jgi:hypothetical protein
MAKMTDMMVDTETTDTNPHTGGIFQLSAVKFNYQTGEIGGTFDRFPSLLPFRRWNEGTRHFWQVDNRELYQQIIAKEEAPEPVFRDFRAFASDGPENGYRFWAKPTTFDWGFVASHFEQLGMPMPFHYRYARDLNTFIAALHGGADHVNIEDQVTNMGQKHNGVHDCAYQIDCLFHAKSKFVHAEVVQ